MSVGEEEIMPESYTAPRAVTAEPTYSTLEVTRLLGRLLPGIDGALLLNALRAESSESAMELTESPDAGPDALELARVRRIYRAGEEARVVHHAMSNTLTALQTEAQLLELEPLADEHRWASTRIVELTRRLAMVMRRLDPGATRQRTA
jgi:hypothetical protein